MEITASKTFIEHWRTLTTPDRDQLSAALSKKCNVAIATPSCWGRGVRTPKEQSQRIITAYLRAQGHEVDQKTLFPE